jgi:hypothetical protein
LEIFSKNEKFKLYLQNKYGPELERMNSTSNKNALTQQLQTAIKLLRDKNSIMAVKFDEFLENYYKLRVRESMIYALIPEISNPTGFGTNQRFAQQGQPASLSSIPPISLQSSGLLQPASPLSSPQNLPQVSASLQSSASVSNPLKTTANLALIPPLLPLSIQSNLPLVSALPQTNLKPKPKSLKNKTLDFFSGLSKKNTRQSGGKKIQMRTYHFLKNKKYSERAFIAERPIIAADNAYDFMKLHYDIGSKKITFTIHDRVNNKKYKYTARTLKDGTNIIKSAK